MCGASSQQPDAVTRMIFEFNHTGGANRSRSPARRRRRTLTQTDTHPGPTPRTGVAESAKGAVPTPLSDGHWSAVFDARVARRTQALAGVAQRPENETARNLRVAGVVEAKRVSEGEAQKVTLRGVTGAHVPGARAPVRSKISIPTMRPPPHPPGAG